MITCPKCGFEQPEDQFCAKCGIMMQGFVPESKGLTERLAHAPYLLTAIALALIGAGIYFFADSSQWDTGTEVPTPGPDEVVVRGVGVPRPTPTSQAGATPTTTTPTTNPPDGAQQNAQLNQQGQNVTGTQGTPQVTGTPIAGAAGAGAGGGGATDEKPHEISVRLDYALVSEDLLERISHESDKPLALGRYTVAAVSRFRGFYERITRDPAFEVQDSDSKKLTVGQPAIFFKGGRHPKLTDSLGFYVEITPQSQTHRSTDLLIQLKRNLLETNPAGELSVATSSITEHANLPLNAGLVLSGILPVRQIPAGEEENMRMPVLKVLLDPRFQRNEVELILLIYPRVE